MSAPSAPLRLPNLAGLALLVVDDDPDTVEILVTFLKACGAHVLAAVTASGALVYAEEAWKLDAVIADIAMPGIDGVEFARSSEVIPYEGAAHHRSDGLLRRVPQCVLARR